MTLLPLLLAAFSPTSEAASYAHEELPMEQLATRADRVIRGQVLSTRSELLEEGIFTVATLRVKETLRGQPELITEVKVPGGSWNGIHLDVSGAPELIIGDEMLLFLDEDRIVGLEKGAMLVAGEYAWRPGRLGAFAAPTNYRNGLDELLHDPKAEIWHLDEVRMAL